MGIFTKLFGNPENASKEDSLLCNGFLNPVVDNGELLEAWKLNNEKNNEKIDKFISQKICPYLNAPCVKEKCISYRGYREHILHYEVPLCEKLDAWIEKRQIKKAYIGNYECAKCMKDVF